MRSRALRDHTYALRARDLDRVLLHAEVTIAVAAEPTISAGEIV